jgi:hypothetical protein
MMRYTSVRPSPDVIYRDLDGEAVLLDLASGRYFGLNAVATRVWVQLHEGTAVDTVIAAIAEEFDGDPDEIARDVAALLEELVSRGLLVVGSAPLSGAP